VLLLNECLLLLLLSRYRLSPETSGYTLVYVCVCVCEQFFDFTARKRLSVSITKRQERNVRNIDVIDTVTLCLIFTFGLIDQAATCKVKEWK
jgi:hypothetical protein